MFLLKKKSCNDYEVMDVFIPLIVVIISQCITYINNNLSIYNFILFISLKYVILF